MAKYQVPGNIIVADEAYVEREFPGQYELIPEPPAVEDPADWLIGIGAFFDRFGAQKIPILASPDLVVQAIIKDVQVRQAVDLMGRRQDVSDALDALISKGFPLDKDALMAMPTPAERYRG